MRSMCAVVFVALLLCTSRGEAQDARGAPITEDEDRILAERSARTPELEAFAGGGDLFAGLAALVYVGALVLTVGVYLVGLAAYHGIKACVGSSP